MIQRFVGDLETRCSERVLEECKRMGAGQCADFEDYAGRVGFIRGMTEGVKIAKELLKANAQDDDPEFGVQPLRRHKL